MTREQIERKLKKLSRKICCINSFGAPTIEVNETFAVTGTTGTLSVESTDRAGEIQIGMSSSTATNTLLCTITFSTPYTSKPSVVMYPSSSDAIIDIGASKGLYILTSTTGFELWTNNTAGPTINKSLKFFYQVI